MEQEVNPNKYEQDLFIAFIRLIASSTQDCVTTIKQFVSLIPDFVMTVQTMKDSGMTEDEIVQKIMAKVRETQCTSTTVPSAAHVAGASMSISYGAITVFPKT